VKLLCTADLHYRLPQLDWLVEQAADVDVVVVPGDLLQVVGAAPLEVQIVVVSKYLRRIAERTLVLASSGNHDLDGPGETGEQATAWLRELAADRLVVDGHSVDVDEVRFTVCPWWDGPETKRLVDEQLAAAAIDRPDRWIWVYHSPPSDSPLCNAGERSFPDPDLAAWIDRWRPDLVICGHIHQAPWVEGGAWVDRRDSTWLINAGHQPGPMPAHVVIDLDPVSGHATAEWVALPDRDLVDMPFAQ
jgi:Icc-related predicted phosphoesterase